MTYTVVGITSGDMHRFMNLPLEIRRYSLASGMLNHGRNAVVLGVNSTASPDDFEMLSSRFKREFELFGLLNDTAVEAFEAVGATFMILGAIHDAELHEIPSNLFACPF